MSEQTGDTPPAPPPGGGGGPSSDGRERRRRRRRGRRSDARRDPASPQQAASPDEEGDDEEDEGEPEAAAAPAQSPPRPSDPPAAPASAETAAAGSAPSRRPTQPPRRENDRPRGPEGRRPDGGRPSRPEGERREARPDNRPNDRRRDEPRRREEPRRDEPRRDEARRDNRNRPDDRRENRPPRPDRPQPPRDERRPDPAQPRRPEPAPERRPTFQPRSPSLADDDNDAAHLEPAAFIPGDDDSGPPTEVRPTDPPLPPRDEDGEDVFVDLDDEGVPHGVIANVAGVKFHDAGTIHEYDAGESFYARGERVVVETDRGPILASVAVPARRRPAGGMLRRILKRAGAEEQKQVERNAKREREALLFARERARARNLPIKVVRAEYPLSGQKVLFYFVSEERIDFRDLVKDIATRIHGRIEMRQIGARDEAKLVGGIGACGRELCCSTFLPGFAPVSIKMAKDQNLVLNPTKVAGQCGRLKCCLVYENDLYAEMRKGLPKLGKRVRTPGGDGRVVELDVLRQRIRVQFEEGGSEVFPASVVEKIAFEPGGGGGPPSNG